MFKIVKREQFSPVTYLWKLEAPDIAKAAQPGHFVIVRHGDGGERVPLTIADFDRQAGTITLVIQAVGKTTTSLMGLKEGEYLDDLAGPLGHARKFDQVKKVVCVGGGLGVAPTYPQLRQYKQNGAHTISIVGFRSKDLMFWIDRFQAESDEMIIATDDGSFGVKGLVTGPLQEVLDKSCHHDEGLRSGDQATQHQDHRQPEPSHGGRHRHVRRVPRDRGGQDGLCLRGRTRVRRPAGRLQRTAGPGEAL